jgi:iron(III) transport system permease protein
MAAGRESRDIRVRRRFRLELSQVVVLGLSLVILVLFIVYPLAKVVASSFVEKGKAITAANLTLANFAEFTSSRLYRGAFRNTMVVGLLTVGFSCLLGVPMAWFLAKTGMPFKTLFLSLGTLPLILPPFIGAYSWVLLFGRRGMLTFLLNQLTGIALPDIYGAPGVIVAMSLSYYPFPFLLTYGALLSADPSLEESAEIMGAARLRIARTLTLPLVLPAIVTAALTVFIRAVGNFGVPALLGGNYYVLPTLIYFQVTGYFNLNAAAAISLVNVAMVAVAIILSQRVTAARSYVTISSRTQAARESPSPVLKWAGFAFCALAVLLSLLPHLTVIFTSFTEGWSGTRFPRRFSLQNYSRILEIARQPLSNSLLLATVATVAASVVGTLLSYISSRRGMRARWVLDLTVMLPFILPGIIVGVAILTGFSSGLLVLSGTWLILVVGYFIRRMPYVFRSTTASLAQMDAAIEEASTIAGAPWGTTFRRVTLPLMLPGILAGAVISFSTLMGELSTTVMLYSARWKTITVAIMEYLFSATIGPAYALGTILIVLVLGAISLANRIMGRTMSQMFRVM